MLDRKKNGKWDVPEEEFLANASPTKIMIFASQMHRRKIEKLVGKTGIHRAQHRMLMTLSDREFDSQAELAAMLEISTATVAVSLKKLERDGYIRKTAKAEDSRANFVQLTEKGKQVVEDSREIFEYIDEQAIKDFTDEELVFLRTYLKRIYDNLSEINEKGRWNSHEDL